jgi:hypothetical protein
MIDYIEVRDFYGQLRGIIDTAESIIWHSVYFGVGDFEVVVDANTPMYRNFFPSMLITRPDNDEVGIIERVEKSRNAEGKTTVVLSGRFYKSMLANRLIYNLKGWKNHATILRGNVETAVREVVKNNAIQCPFNTLRNIPLLGLGELARTNKTIVDSNGSAAQKQVSYENLLEYTDAVLEEYGLGAKVTYSAGSFFYAVYEGADRTIGNAAGVPSVVFSPEYDNLTESSYITDESTLKNIALVGGEGEGLERKYTEAGGYASGISRKEIWVDASSIARKYTDEDGTEKEYSDLEYITMLRSAGMQTISEHKTTKEASGTLDLTNGTYRYGRDFWLGDMVTLQDNALGIQMDIRICEILESQDESGYTISAVYK